jgi:NTE family protein
MVRRRIGLALGSGAARGWSHIGVIDALHEAGIEPEIVCGTSIGSFVGAAYVAGRLDALRHWARALTWREMAELLDVRLSGGGLIDGKLIVAFLRKMGIDGPIESYAKSYAAVATDLATGREIWLQSGPIHEAVRASITMPGILTPVRTDDRWLVDGGLTNPVPVSVCRALGADVVIAVNLNGDLLGRRFSSEGDAAASSQPPRAPKEFIARLLSKVPAGIRDDAATVASRLLPQQDSRPGYFDVLTNCINIMQDHITRSRLAGEPPHVLLVPQLRDIGVMEFYRAEEMMAEGRHCVAQALPTLRRFL